MDSLCGPQNRQVPLLIALPSNLPLITRGSSLLPQPITVSHVQVAYMRGIALQEEAGFGSRTDI